MGTAAAHLVLRIVAHDAPNAGTDGACVFLTTGLIGALSSSELANVIGHEIAHVVRGHLEPSERSLPPSGDGPVVAVFRAAIDAARARTREHEADCVGEEIAGRAGYGRHLDEALSKIAGAGPDGPFARHPLTADRVRRLRDSPRPVVRIFVRKSR